MPFISLEFAAFLLIVWALHWLVPARAQNAVLVLAGLTFCAAGAPWFALALLLASAVEFGIGLRLEWERPAQSRLRWLWVAVMFDVGLLAFFKYGSELLGHVAERLGAL